MSGRTVVLHASLAALFVALVTAAGALLKLSPITQGFLFLLVVLLVAMRAGLVVSTITSLLASVCFNYFFLPPLYELTIADPRNWVALMTLLGVSVLVTRLVVRARDEAAASAARRKEIEALYELSVQFLTASNRVGALGEATTRALLSIGANGGGLVLFDGSVHRHNVAAWIGEKQDYVEDLLSGVGRHGQTLEFPAAEGRDVYLPLIVGGHRSGVLVARQVTTPRKVLESVAALLALAVEREKFLAENAHLHAIRESDGLKTSILRAVSHDLKTPLTAMALHIEALRRVIGDGRGRESLAELDQENSRLRRRIENLLSMARLDAGRVAPRPEPIPPGDLFRSSLDSLALLNRSRSIETSVAGDCPDVLVDPSLALEMIVNLIENAHRASPAEGSIELVARRHPVDEDRVRIEILDRGSGVGHASSAFGEVSPVIDDGDLPSRGLGLEIARSLAAASGGSAILMSRAGGGAVARIDLPAASMLLPAEEHP